jgi:hypothetical protein
MHHMIIQFASEPKFSIWRRRSAGAKILELGRFVCEEEKALLGAAYVSPRTRSMAISSHRRLKYK